MILTGLLMWFIARSSFAYTMVLPYTAEAGTVFIVIGMVVVGLGIREFSRLQTTVNPLDLTASTRLATQSIYRYTRNPMYLGLTLILVGWGLHLDSPVNVLCVIAFVIIMNEWQIKPEEAALRELFGEEYEAYCRRVRRWL
jgi:protein-S-isoprenylcysteine O-methyltransferase Ste14